MTAASRTTLQEMTEAQRQILRPPSIIQPQARVSDGTCVPVPNSGMDDVLIEVLLDVEVLMAEDGVNSEASVFTASELGNHVLKFQSAR